MSVMSVRADGPLERFRDGIKAALEAQGYSDGRAGKLMLLVGNLGRWLGERDLDSGDLTVEVVAEFFTTSRRSWCRSARSLTPVLDHLRSIGVAPLASRPQVGRTPSEVELWEAFRRWCVVQRGLKAATAEDYVRRAEACLRGCWSDGEVTVGELTAGDVLAAVRAAADVLPGPSLRCTVTALRSLLRFAHATGRTRWPLVGAVPAIRARLRTVLPSPASEETAQRLVASCDTTTGTGRRDAAILVVLVRLGLRAGEVARLSLDDVDWRRGEVMVAGKGGRADVMPLPVDVGEGLASYLSEGRPVTTCRSLFVKAVAPFGQMTSDGVSAVVRLGCQRAGVARVGPHRLRHLVASSTLAAGGSLTEVAQLLRHADVSVTTIYAAVDPVSVAALARPWPGSFR